MFVKQCRFKSEIVDCIRSSRCIKICDGFGCLRKYNSDFAIFIINAIFKNPRDYQDLEATVFIISILQYDAAN